jgi:type IV pilus assembly protein PilA
MATRAIARGLRDEGITPMRKQKGFSLIELLIVVAIILIIAAIAIPNLLRARIAANESSAAASVRTIDTAMLSYQTAFPTVGYPAAIGRLGTGGVNVACPGAVAATACIIDGQLASGNKSGYTFTLTSAGGPPTNTFDVSAVPATLNTTGVKEFCSVEDNVVRFLTPSAGTGATSAGCLGLPPIGQ